MKDKVLFILGTLFFWERYVITPVLTGTTSSYSWLLKEIRMQVETNIS